MQNMRILALPLMGMGTFVSEAWTSIRGETPHSDVPAMKASLGTIVEAVLDRSFTLGVNLMAGVPNPTEVRDAKLAVERAALAAEENRWLEEPLGFHEAPPPLRRWQESEAVGYTPRGRIPYATLKFKSGYRPHASLQRRRWNAYEPNRDAYAYVMQHGDGSDRPWLVCIHGFSQGGAASGLVSFNTKYFHEVLGLNVLMPILPLHGPRASGSVSGGDVMTSDFVNMLHFFAQAVWDIRRMLSWLRDKGASQIGLWGVSMGGYTTALLSAFEEDLACVIAGVPPTDFANVARDNMPWIMKSYEQEMTVDWNDVRKMMHVVSPLTFDPVVAKERRFIYAGTADRVVRPDQSRALWRRWDQPEIRWISGGHVAMQFKKDVWDFVEEALTQTGMLAPKD